MILQKPLELLVNCRRDFSLVLYCEEMIDNLTIMFALPRQAKRRVLLLVQFRRRSSLDVLGRFPRMRPILLRLWNLVVHQCEFRIDAWNCSS